MRTLLLVITGCAPLGAGPPSEPTSRCEPADPRCVDLDAAAPLWRTGPGWTVRDLLLGDVDGDGEIDAVVDLWDGSAGHGSVVLGPFAGQRILPRDESLGIDAPVALVGDVSGDGVADVIYEWEDGDDPFDPELGVLEGPLEAPVSPTTGSRLPPGGVEAAPAERRRLPQHLVFVREGDSAASVRAWSGHWRTWGVEPATVSVTLPWDDDLSFSFLADLDADGAAELGVYGTDRDGHAGRWIVPGSARGAVEAPGSASALPIGLGQDPVWLGDVDGDGDGDFLSAGSWRSGPLSLSAAGWPGGSPLFAEATAAADLEPVLVDLDLDGGADFRRRGREVRASSRPGAGRGWTWEYLTSGPSGGVSTGRSVGRVVHDTGLQVVHVGARVVGFRVDGDAVVVVAIPGAVAR